jgi:DNA-binding beta-propeller fold protein YncE
MKASYPLVLFCTGLLLSCAKAPNSSDNGAPVLSDITSTTSQYTPGQAYWFHALATDPDGDALTWNWAANLGELELALGDSVRWQAPDSSAYIRLSCEVTDTATNADADTLRFWVSNQQPLIMDITADQSAARFGSTVTLSAQVIDPDSQEVECTWSSPFGILQPLTATTAHWTLPDTTVRAWVELIAQDSEGASHRDSLFLPVYEERGCAWVVNQGAAGIVKLSSIGDEILRIPNLTEVSDLAIDTENRRLWVAHSSDALSSFDFDGLQTSTMTGLARPSHLACWERTGQIWVLESDSSRITAIDFSGTTAIRHIRGFRRPNSLAIHQEDGSLWVCDEGVGRVYHLQGDLEADIQDPDSSIFAQSKSGFTFPAHVAVEDSSGAAWVADRDAGRLFRFLPNFSDSLVLHGLQEPARCAPPGAEGLCWVLERGSQPTIFRAFYDQVQVQVSGFSDPRGLAATPESGHVWVSDAGRNSVLLYDSYGVELLRKHGFDQPGLIIVHRGY